MQRACLWASHIPTMWIVIVWPEDSGAVIDYIIGPFPTREAAEQYADELPYPDSERSEVFYMNPDGTHVDPPDGFYKNADGSNTTIS